ncbi:MAG TPA: oxidoreductase, partial [Armatimonadetes bacterium]|nr:oxidoreductase [Armatimonadota bacterium]
MTTQPMTRRESLRRLGGMAAGLGMFHIVPAWGQGNPAPSERLTCAAIGVGGMGSGNLGNLLGRGDVRVVAVCDVE